MAIFSKSFNVEPTTQFIPPSHEIENILEPIAHHAIYNPHYPVFQYADAHKVLHRVTWIQIVNALQSVADFVEKHCDISRNSSEPYIIGILANLDSIAYFCLIFGITLAGCVPFPISLRNSAEGIAHLLSTTNCRTLFTSEDRRTQDLCNASLRLLDGTKISSFVVPTLGALFEQPMGRLFSLPPRNARSHDLCLIYHSSGSTGHPKPIFLSHEVVVKWSIGTAYRDHGVDPTGEIVSIHGLPFYHAMAHNMSLSCIMVGTVVSVFDPTQEIFVPSPDSVIEAAILSRSNKIFTIPSFIDAWSKNPAHVEMLKGFESVVFSGAPISYDVGEELYRAGVNLSSTYGSTETGPLTVFARSDVRLVGWNWLKMRPGLDVTFIPDDGDSCKLIIKENKLRKLTVYNTVVNGVPAYDTNDIVERHPTNPSLWRVKNRQDTLIVHSSGEKTDPIPIEERLKQDERIAAAVMFGREKPLPGVIILPAKNYFFETPNKYRNMIWDTVLEANEIAPSHSRIYKEMIIIANSKRPFEYTEKGMPKRHAILNEYHDDIQKVFIDTDSCLTYDVSISNGGSGGSNFDVARCFVRTIFRNTLSTKLSENIGDNDNIFQCGADSLCAISIRNNLVHALSSYLPATQREEARSLLPQDLIFSHPTINSLSLMVSHLSIWPHVKEFDSVENKEAKTEVDSNIPSWESHLDTLRTPSGMIKFKDGKGDIPIILIPDVAGSAGIFIASHHLYQSAVWACDTTHMPPNAFKSMQDLVSFYLDQILRERPTGPYRFASYSGSCVVLQCIAQFLEQAGHKVLQVAFLDHYPSHFINNVNDPTTFNPHISDADLDDYVRNNFRSIHKMWTATKDDLEAIGWLINAYEAVIYDKPIDSRVEHIMKRMWNTISITIKFLFGDEFRVNGEWSCDIYNAWLKSMNAIPVVYLTTEGIAAFCEDPGKEFATGLGVTVAYSNARVLIVPGEHMDVLSNEIVVADQERDFI